MSVHSRQVRGVSHRTFDDRASFARACGTSATEPSRPTTSRISTGLEAIHPAHFAQRNSAVNAASSRFHLAPPI
ncbi:hypothetical protein ACFU7Z_32665 [Kitasatospora sp. NPDC057518]|uniref:hypothetical protein n=1 Tax=Kitasatospora sp. NPDC057518 TaxID=3346155 RepID=UPI00369743DB